MIAQQFTQQQLIAMLTWQVEMGADEAVLDKPSNDLQPLQSSDDISELNKVSSLLNKKEHTKIPGFTSPTPGPMSKKDPSLDKLAVALIEFIIKKTQDPEDWTYIINTMVEKLGLEFEDDDEAEGDI